MTDKEILDQLKDKLETKKADLTDRIKATDYYDDPKFVKLELINELLEFININHYPKFKPGNTIIAKENTSMERVPFHIDKIEDDAYWDGPNSILICNQDEFELVSQESTLMILFPAKERDDKHICFYGGCSLFSGQKQEGLCEALWKSPSFRSRNPLASICNYYDTMKPTIIEAQNISIEEIQERIKG